jgi:histidinol-phosphate phosphatase family protein
VRFLGIDLAWSPRNPSGAALLAPDGQLLEATGNLGGDDEIVELIARALPEETPGVVAIDAPLAIPNETGARPCDREVGDVFRRFEAAPYPANRRHLAPYGGLRAEEIRRRLADLGFVHTPHLERQAPTRQVVEVFPHPATITLFGLERTLKYKARPGRDLASRRRQLRCLRDHLAALCAAEPPLCLSRGVLDLDLEGRRGRKLKETEDLLDAVLCAYSALHAWHYGPRGYAAYGRGALESDPELAHILVPMTPAAWQRIKGERVLFLDRDGTLNHSLGHRPPNHPGEVELLPGIAAKIHHAASLGWRIVIITNQGGVAFGYQTHRQAWLVHRSVLDALPVTVDASYLCPHHPDGTDPRYAVTCPNRKPAPGFLLDALARYDVRPEQCLFVGDMDTDWQAAQAAGIPFEWAPRYFGGGSHAPAGGR